MHAIRCQSSTVIENIRDFARQNLRYESPDEQKGAMMTARLRNILNILPTEKV